MSDSTVKRFVLWHECDSLLRKQENGEWGRKPLIVIRGDNPQVVLDLSHKLHGVMNTAYAGCVQEERSSYSRKDTRFRDIFPAHYYSVVVLKQVMSDEVYLRVAKYLAQFGCLPLAETEWVVSGADPKQVDTLLHKFYLPSDVEPEVEEVQPAPEVQPEPEVEQEQPAPEPQPSMSWNKVQILQYLVERGVAAPKQATKRELLALAK